MTTTSQKVRDGAEKVFYASVGAPVVTSKKYAEFVRNAGESLRTKTSGIKDIDMSAKVSNLRTKAADDLKSAFESWTNEGEELIKGLKDQKVVEDLAERVNFDQLQEQAGKLRAQLEDLVGSWRANFAPEEVVEKAADKTTKVVRKAETKVIEGVKDVSEKLTKDEDLTVINGIGPAYAIRLKEANIDTVGKLAAASVEELATSAKVSPELAKNWIAQAKSL